MLARDGKLPPGVAVDYVLQAGEAIAEAHAAGFVHRDLKPANLFLAQQSDGTSIIKVLDFGISKAVIGEDTSQSRHALTGTADIFGSPLYMSPEQLKSARDVDARADIWAIGVILYELISGVLALRPAHRRRDLRLHPLREASPCATSTARCPRSSTASSCAASRRTRTSG